MLNSSVSLMGLFCPPPYIIARNLLLSFPIGRGAIAGYFRGEKHSSNRFHFLFTRLTSQLSDEGHDPPVSPPLSKKIIFVSELHKVHNLGVN